MSIISELPSALPASWNFAELQVHLGDVPPERIRIQPAPGTATVEDVIQIEARENRLYELIDGTLVEKTVGHREAKLAALLGGILLKYLESHDLGTVLGADGTLRILPEMVRIPDVCFIGWDRYPPAGLPPEQIPPLVPDLAIEILSPSNRPGEMNRKLTDYFQAGVRLVWYVDAQTRIATVYSSTTDPVQVPAEGKLSGGDLLPGLEISLAEIFAEVDRTGPKQ